MIHALRGGLVPVAENATAYREAPAQERVRLINMGFARQHLAQLIHRLGDLRALRTIQNPSLGQRAPKLLRSLVERAEIGVDPAERAAKLGAHIRLRRE